jgi:hypothetical protein
MNQSEHNKPPQSRPHHTQSIPTFSFAMATTQIAPNLLWASTGGGWRAMFGCVGYANVFQQAGLFTADSSHFDAISTVSGGSWFSTQFFYSEEFSNRTAMAPSPQAISDFVVEWMNSYLEISVDIDDETKAACNFTDLYNGENDEQVTTIIDVCYLLVKYDNDWALFIQGMLESAATDYGTPGFTDILATAANRIVPMRQTDLYVQAAMSPTSRIRSSEPDSTTSDAVYLGYQDETSDPDVKLLTVALPVSWIVDTQSGISDMVYGTNDLTSEEDGYMLQTYVATTLNEHQWGTWQPFYLYKGNGTTTGNITVSSENTAAINPTTAGLMSKPFGGNDTTTVLQVASISSAAAGMGSGLVASAYTQWLSIGRFTIEENTTRTVWRVLAGIAAGLGAGILFGVGLWWVILKVKCCKEEVSKKWALSVGITVGVLIGLMILLVTFFFYGTGSIIVPDLYDDAVNQVYMNETYDNFAVCSQWPNLPCGPNDAYMFDGWLVDNPALAINIGQSQDRTALNETLKVILTNCDEVWDTEWNRAQYLAYFSTYFNEGIAPGDFSWGPGWFVPSRSQQIFSEYLDPAGLDALLEPIPNSNMTTALLVGTTIDNPAYGVAAGQRVEMLLLNLNTNITTYVIGSSQILDLTQPLADMASRVAGNEELRRRVTDFVTL